MGYKHFVKAIDNVISEQVYTYNNAQRAIRYSIESAIIDIMNMYDIDTIKLEGENEYEFELNNTITAVIKGKDNVNECDDVILFELTITDDDGNQTIDTKRLYNFNTSDIITIWDTIVNIYAKEED